MPFAPSQSRRVWMAAVVGTLSLAGAAGCGYETYELRLKQSKDYYNYLEKVDANLAPKWGDGRGILEVRVPKQFVPIPSPQPIKREDGELEMPTVDPRQPDYVNLIFPELLGAWEAPVEITLADGGRETRKAYIYAVSNYWTLISENPGDAQFFTKSLTELIGAALEQPPKETPETEMQMSMGPSVIGRFSRAGGKPTFGCDIISNNSGDLLAQARLGLQTERLLECAEILKSRNGADEVTMTTADMLRAMTVDAAGALGIADRVGTLSAGKEADLILVRLDDINTMPLHDASATLLLHAHPGNVDTVFVAGRCLKRHGKLIADMSRVRQLLMSSHEYIKTAIARDRSTLPPGYKAA